MRAPWTSTLFRVNGNSAEMGWLMMAPLARPRRAQRQEVAQGGDEIAPTVDRPSFRLWSCSYGSQKKFKNFPASDRELNSRFSASQPDQARCAQSRSRPSSLER